MLKKFNYKLQQDSKDHSTSYQVRMQILTLLYVHLVHVFDELHFDAPSKPC